MSDPSVADGRTEFGSETETDRCLDAIAASELGAFQSVFDAEARSVAAGLAASDTHRVAGPFHGRPFALKDIVDVNGRVATAGSKALEDRVSMTTATIARRLLSAGGVLVGKTKTVEFALGGWGTNQHMGTPRNPWEAEHHRVPGGSSSGSGVAVASGLVPFAIGTDTGGSVRLPASLCGIVGLKTTAGLLPTDGIVPLSHTLDTPGPMAKTVADTALMFDVLRGRPALDLADDWRRGNGLARTIQQGVAGLRLGVLTTEERAVVATGVLARYDEAVSCLADAGAEIVEFRSPLPFEVMKDMTFVIVTAEGWYHHGHLFADPDAPLDEAVRGRGLPGRDRTARDYIEALETCQQHRREFLESLGTVDALLTPTTPEVAPRLDEVDEAATPAHFTRAGNYLGLCGLSVPSGLAAPAGQTAPELPAGLQILTRPNDEALVLRIGAEFERLRPPLPTPPLHARLVG